MVEAIQENGVLQDFGDAEETLSLSDLPLSSNFSSENKDHYSKQYENSSFDQDNFFEFFSEDFTASTADYPTKDIIFCGKLISDKTTQSQETIKSISPRNGKKSRVFPWKSGSFRISKQEKFYKTCESFPFIENDKSKGDFSRNKAKSRWNLFGRFPVEMELRDIKTRQSKRRPSTMFQLCDNNKPEMVKTAQTKRLKGLWGLLRVFAFA